MALEIERKWVVKYNPFSPEATFRKQHITQFYWEGARYRSVIENGVKTFIKTVKTGDGLVREEIEHEISNAEIMDAFEKAGEPTCVVKTRQFVKSGYSYHTIEFDILKDGEMYAKIEFKTVYDSVNFSGIPSWFGEEVTHDKQHTNYEIFKRLNGVE